jgi:hypothetical protein
MSDRRISVAVKERREGGVAIEAQSVLLPGLDERALYDQED